MRHLKANHRCGKGFESVNDGVAAIVSNPHATEPFKPTNRPLGNPADLSQVTSMFTALVTNVGLNPQKSKGLARGSLSYPAAA